MRVIESESEKCLHREFTEGGKSFTEREIGF